MGKICSLKRDAAASRRLRTLQDVTGLRYVRFWVTDERSNTSLTHKRRSRNKNKSSSSCTHGACLFVPMQNKFPTDTLISESLLLERSPTNSMHKWQDWRHEQIFSIPTLQVLEYLGWFNNDGGWRDISSLFSPSFLNRERIPALEQQPIETITLA